jgi:hypothetical protein
MIVKLLWSLATGFRKRGIPYGKLKTLATNIGLEICSRLELKPGVLFSPGLREQYLLSPGLAPKSGAYPSKAPFRCTTLG